MASKAEEFRAAAAKADDISRQLTECVTPLTRLAARLKDGETHGYWTADAEAMRTLAAEIRIKLASADAAMEGISGFLINL